MKLDDINLDNIKVAIFDFDNTLAIHKNKDYLQQTRLCEQSRINYYLNSYIYPDCFYDEIEPCLKSEALWELINNFRNKNIKMYCLSGMNFSFNLKTKQSFINKYYGEDIEVMSSSSQRLKLEGTKIIQSINNCKLSEILFFDDRQDVIDLLNENGIKGINVCDIKLSNSEGYREINK